MAVILPQSIQSDIQSNLPIMPNNGNPSGAYNMPQEGVAASAAAAPEDPYAWLKPSPYMDEVNNILSQQDSLLEQTVFEANNPQTKQLYNILVQGGGINVQPLNDYGMTMGLSAFDDTPATYALPIGYEESPQYLPILPGE